MNIKKRANEYLNRIDDIYSNMSDNEFFGLMNDSGFNIPLDTEKDDMSIDRVYSDEISFNSANNSFYNGSINDISYSREAA